MILLSLAAQMIEDSDGDPAFVVTAIGADKVGGTIARKTRMHKLDPDDGFVRQAKAIGTAMTDSILDLMRTLNP